MPVVGDEFTRTFTADRTADEGPLGTFWGIETFDDESITTIANPVFLADELPPAVERSDAGADRAPGGQQRAPRPPPEPPLTEDVDAVVRPSPRSSSSFSSASASPPTRRRRHHL